jgi:hypothetical protein
LGAAINPPARQDSHRKIDIIFYSLVFGGLIISVVTSIAYQYVPVNTIEAMHLFGGINLQNLLDRRIWYTSCDKNGKEGGGNTIHLVVVTTLGIIDNLY